MISSDSFFLNNGVDTVFLTRVKEGDSCEGKMADLEETKRHTGLESADGPEEYSTKMLICQLWCSADGELPMKSRKERRIRTLRKLDDSVIIF